MPRDLRGLLAAITNNHLMIFDNIDNCDVEEEGYTDYLCKASTGGMVTIAELYKTNVDKKYNLRCDLFFTARVNPWPAHRSDLSRRTLFFPFRKPEQHEYKTVESMQEEMKADRDEMLIETLVRLQTIVKSLHSNMGVSYKPMSEMHSFETFTMRAANYEGWRQGMEDIWKGYFEEYETRITEYSPLVDEIRKWLGTSLKGGAYPNRGRKVTMGKLFEEIRRQVALDNGGYGGCTWKNESTFGRAVNKHYTSLRVLGVNKSTLNGYKCLTFDPKDDQWKMCIQAGKDLNLYHRAEDEQDLTGLDGIE
jgi:hypothetical protein